MKTAIHKSVALSEIYNQMQTFTYFPAKTEKPLQNSGQQKSDMKQVPY